jgi:ribose 5-phosphate isomerase RpiB
MKIAVAATKRYLTDFIVAELKKRGRRRCFGPLGRRCLDAVERLGRRWRRMKRMRACCSCYTGTGASMTAKVPGIRAALCGDAATARAPLVERRQCAGDEPAPHPRSEARF